MVVDNIIYQHDVLIKKYRWWKQCGEQSQQKGDTQTARELSFLADGVSYAFTQVFNEDIETAKLIYNEDKGGN